MLGRFPAAGLDQTSFSLTMPSGQYWCATLGTESATLLLGVWPDFAEGETTIVHRLVIRLVCQCQLNLKNAGGVADALQIGWCGSFLSRVWGCRCEIDAAQTGCFLLVFPRAAGCEL